MTSIYLWVRSIRSLRYFLPILDVEDAERFSDFAEICLELIEKFGGGEDVKFGDFAGVCEEKIEENLQEAVFQNAREDLETDTTLESLIYSIIFTGLQQKPPNFCATSRAELVLHNLKENFCIIFKIIYQLKYRRLLSDKQIYLDLSEKEDFEFLDKLLEGTVKQKHITASNKSCVRPFSEISGLIFDNGYNTLNNVCAKISTLLILDPYHIDELPFDKVVQGNSFRRTTLAHNSRRVVHIHNVNKIELLRKDEFANIHLRMCHDKPKASFIFAPLRTETVFLHSLEFCQGIVLGCVQGLVVIDSCRNFKLSVACQTLIMVNCSKLDVHFMSPRRPIILNCEFLNLAPLNTTYDGHLRFLEESGLRLEDNKILKEPINLGNSSWKFMDDSKFLYQLTPLHSTESDFDHLVVSLPEMYRKAAHRNIIEAERRLEDADVRISDVVSNRDLIYLKSKIDKICQE